MSESSSSSSASSTPTFAHDHNDWPTRDDLIMAEIEMERERETQNYNLIMKNPLSVLGIKEHVGIIKKARSNVLTRYYETIFQEKLKELVEDPEKVRSPEGRQFLQELGNVIDLKSSDLMFITINPPEMERAEQELFINKVHQFAHRDKHKGYHYCFETRSDDGTCTGLHMHMLVRLDKKAAKSTIQNQTFKAFKKFVPDKMKVCVKAMRNEAYLKSIETYIGRSGRGKHLDDAVLRSLYELEDVYKGGAPFSTENIQTDISNENGVADDSQDPIVEGVSNLNV